MTVLLDAGALLAAERDDRAIWKQLLPHLASGEPPLTHAGVVAQVWRGGARQARLARVLAAVEVVPLDEALARSAGVLLGLSRTSDVVDAALVRLALDGDVIVTSDAGDLRRLATAHGRRVTLVRA